MYIITEDGEKLPVDTSSVDYDHGYHPWYQHVAAVDDDTAYLRDVWIVELQRTNEKRSFDWFECEWFKDIYHDHEPSEEEIMYDIIRSGGHCNNTIAFVKHGYMMDIEYD